VVLLSVYWILEYSDPPVSRPPQQPIFFSKELKATYDSTKKTLVRRRLTRRTNSKRIRHEDPLTRLSS
jgi:hypothetical protein